MLHAVRNILIALALAGFSLHLAAQKKSGGDSLITNISCRGTGNKFFKASLYPHSVGVQKSSDAGKTWGQQVWACPVKNGGLCSMDGVSLRSSLNFVCDTGSGPFSGRLYLCWSDERFGTGRSDVFLSYSDDDGGHFTEPLLVTYNPNHKAQCWPAMGINSADGKIFIAYFDKQNYHTGKGSDVYLSVSINGGLQFSHYLLNTQPALISAGSRVNITAHAGKDPEILWSVPLMKPPTVKVVASDVALNAGLTKNKSRELVMEKAFSFSDTIHIPFTTADPVNITAVLTKPLQPDYEKVIFTCKPFKPGKNEIVVPAKKLEIKPDNYTLVLYYGGKNRFVWITSEN